MKRLGLAVVVSTLAACSSNEPAATPKAETPVAVQRAALVQGFAAGSLIIPMDTTSQNNGTLRAFGLVDRLLRANVPVHRISLAGKAHQDIDFSATVTQRESGAALGTVAYRSSPFVIAAADATTTALGIVDAYLASDTVTNVHVATAAFSADVQRLLVAAPRIAVLRDGNEAIAYAYLNAANIRDSQGNAWSDASPGSLTLAQVAGSATGGAFDGALFSAGRPAFDQLTSMHYTPPASNEVVREVRGWLSLGPSVHAYMQCDAILAFENNVNGRFLSSAGMVDDGATATPVTVLQPEDLFNQYSGSLTVDNGSVDSMGLAAGSVLYANHSVLLARTGATLGTRMAWLTGHIDGDVNKGKISYLAGHNYSTTLPISTNPQTNGVRLFLNGLYETPAIFTTLQPTLTLTKSAPAFTNSTTVTFTITYANTGPGIAFASSLSDVLPAGTTFASATAGGVHSAGTVTWALGDLPPGASGSVSVTLTAPQGTHQNQAVLAYRQAATPKTFGSNVTTTVVDTTAPVVTLTSTPADPSNVASGTIGFSVNEPATTTCSFDGGAFVACSSPFAFGPLADGSHSLVVRAVDAAGNSSDRTFTWVVDLTAPALAFTSTPATPSNQPTATFAFTVSGATSVQCSLDGAAFAACASPVTTPALAEGAHTFEVRAADAAGNVATISHGWTVDLTAPALAFTSTPPLLSASATAAFTFTASGATAVECSLDGAAFAPCASPVALAALADGGHTFTVRASDLAGNVTTVAHAWTVDTTPPDVSFTAAPPALSTSADATFAFAVTGGATSVECSLDGAAFAPCTSPVSLTGLAEGNHDFRVRATDAAGNARTVTHAWAVDTAAPDTSFTATPAANAGATSATFSFSSTEGGTFECSLDGAAFAACVSPATLSGLAEGSHTYRARAIDAAGNVDPTPASFTWNVDTTAPTTTLDSTPASASNSTGATFTFSSNEGTATFECSLDGAAFTACTSPQALTGLAEGSHTFQVRAVDAAGNTDGTPASFTWTVDVTPPDTTLTAGPTGTVSSTSASFSFTSTEAGTFECSLDGAAFAACPTPQALSGLAEGSHTFQVRAVDTAGNRDATPASRTWVVDTVEPTTTIDVGPSGFLTVASASFEFSSNEFGATFECSLDGAPFAACPSPLALTALAEGSHTFAVRAVDAAGNRDATPATRTFTVDTLAPDTTILAGPTGAVSSTAATFGFTSDDAAATFECDLDGAGYQPCAATPTFAGLGEGNHTLVVRAVDPAGNRDATPALRAWTVDTIAPETTIAAGPTGPTASASATFDLSSNEATATFECSLDGATFAACSDPATFAGLAEGPHTLAVRAVDAAGNRDGTPATTSWTVDTVVPDTTLLTAPSGLVNASTATFTFESNEAGVTFECSFDNAPFSACTSPVNLTAITDGNHTFQVRARDAAGNVDATPATATWQVDAAEPDTVITAGPTGTVSSTSATFEFTSTKASSTFQCSLDGAAFTSCPSPVTFSGLAEGSHTLEVRAVDPATNVDSSPASRTWVVDTVAPETSVVTAPPAVTNATTAAVDVSSNEGTATFECSLDGAAFAACADPVALTGLADGLHVLLVRAVDAGGNRDASPSLVTWTVDTQAPAAPRVLEPVAGSSTGAFPTFGGTAEPGSTVTVTSGGTPVCTAVVAADGSWSCAPTTALPTGSNTVTATTTDPAGNTSPSSPPLTFTVTPATVETFIRTGPSGLVASTSADFTLEATPAGATFECSLDGAAFTACTASPSFTNLAQGAHHFEARAVSNGTRDATPAVRDWFVDTVAPAAPVLTSPAANATTSATPVFVGTAEPGSSVTVSVDGAPVCTVTADASGAFACAAPTALPPGSHTVTATAKDPVGNTSPPSTGVPFTVDGATLDTAIIAGPSGTVRETRATFAFTATVLGATFECSLDGAAFTACPTPTSFTGLAEGSHTLEVRAVAGTNTDATPASRTWSIDSMAPAAPVVLVPANNSTVYSRTPRYSGTAEAGATVRVSVDDRLACTAVADAFGAWSCSSPTELASGEHRVSAVAVDAAGNVSPSSAVNVFTVDIPTVSVAITAPQDMTLTNDATPTISGTTYPGATVTVFVDGVNVGTTVADGQGNWSFTPAMALADGARVVTAQAEFMGHQSPTSNARTVRIDTTPPVVTLDIDQADPARMPAVSFSANETPVTWACSVDGADFTACESPLDVAAAGDGAHTVTVRATDAAGNTGTATGTWTVVAPLNPPHPLPGELVIRGGGCGCGATDGASAALAFAALLLLASRRRAGRPLRRVSAGPAALGVVLAAGVASAQAVAGFDLERLDLNPGASASLITQTGDVLKKGAYRVSLTGHYQHDSLVLFRTDTNERLGAIVGSRVTAHLAGAWAPLDWLELGLQVPVVLWQGGDDLGAYGIAKPVATAFGTPWLTGRFGLLREAAGAPVDVSLQLGLGLPLGTAGAYTNTTPIAFAPRLGVGKVVLPWLRVGGELGAVVRGRPTANDGTVSQADVGTNLLYGLSATTLGEGLRGELTLRGGIGLEQGQGSAELLIGARYPFAKQFEVYAIGGPGFGTLPGSPAFRVLAGVAWQPPVEEAPKKPVCDDSTPADALKANCPEQDADGDGVKNGIDECPRVVGVESRRGCPVPDTDGDGLTDDVDVCPKEAGLKERRGCPVRDLDNDGLEDDQDECPAEAGPAERKGCPVRDQDQDGVEDEQDKCPAEAGPAERQGCPLKDQDQDTVEDALDNCPTEKGDPANAGCPKKQKQLVVITADKLVIKEKVFFATGKSTVLAKSFPLLDNVARVLIAHPEVKLVRIEGHTDSTGKRETNLKLSQDRADAVKAYLVKQKVEAERLKAVGFGPDQPTATNDTAAGREQNRRVEFNFETAAKSTVQEVPAAP
jgi:uncharacterized repeat protein (TIGR01451 family)